MISFETFLVGLTLVSTMTGLVTEAIKKVMTELNKTYKANVLAGVVAAILSSGTGIGYAILMNTGFGAKTIVCIVALIFFSWLCSMVGYDKVVGLIRPTKKD